MDVPHQTIVTHSDDLATACQRIAEFDVIGMDTEFVGEDRYLPDLCLVQVSTPTTLYLLDPISIGSLDPFWQLLLEPSRRVVVHAGREEIRLCQRFAGKPPANVFDLQIAAGLMSTTYPVGHGALVQQLLGLRIAKGETLTEWRHRPLTRDQVDYAYDDVRFLLELYTRVHHDLGRRNRLGWAREEFDRFSRLVSPVEDNPNGAPEKWRKFKGVYSLNRRSLAILRGIYLWRDELAKDYNRPARVLIRDDLLVEIARRVPKSEKELKVVRGLSHRLLGPLMEVIDRARSLPLDLCPQSQEKEQDPPQVGLVTTVLAACLNDFCAREALAPTLVATNQELRNLVKSYLYGNDLPSDSLLAQGWRAEFVLPNLRALLEGRKKITIADLQSETPFHISE